MSVDSLIFWLFVAAWAVVIGLLAFVQVPRAVSEARRIVRRLLALVDDSPLPLQLAKAEADVARVERAFARLPALESRAAAALSVIRETPLVPPAAVAAVRRIRADFASLRRASR